MVSLILLVVAGAAFFANRFARRRFGIGGVLCLALGGPVLGFVIGKALLTAGPSDPQDGIVVLLMVVLLSVPVWMGQACDLVWIGIEWLSAKRGSRRPS